MDKECRVLSQPIELRVVDGEPSRIVGYASKFNSETVIAGLFREVIAPGAFADAAPRDDVRGLFNHDPNFVFGRTKAGTLTLREDETGLQYDAQPPDTTWARDLLTSIKRGDISGSSFSFTVDVKDEDWEYPKGDLPLRTIKRVSRLYDVSAVTYPAYESATVSARAEEAAKRDAHAAIERADAERVLAAARLRWAKANGNARV